ncbi:glycosyltransferase 87 family protein [Lentzea kentuckyensis]|uniref:glycosyltransferase 87 family protein n=1 Tax=Lentzea kentuckyensis TaxID=360086 RepID=UPI0011799269|nr:glycosyltransferase 87 family protein [Lentzea kentuckyensis]
MPRNGRIALAVIAQLAVVAFVLGTDRFRSLDLDVYRLASLAWRDGGDIYDLPPLHTAAGELKLPFMYPPIAAVALSPLTFLPRGLAIGAWWLVSLLALVTVVYVVVKAIAKRWPDLDVKLTAAAVLPFATLLGPVREDLTFGQVNLVLMALVCLDCLVDSPRWPRGLLVGIAAAIKVLPAVFVLFFLLRKDVRAALVAAGTAIVLTGLGLLLAPGNSIAYWTGVGFDTSRTTDLVGGLWWAPNQSLHGLLGRFHWLPIHTAVVYAVSAVVVVVAVLAMRKALRRAEHGLLIALSLNALIALLVSPIAWTYHWVWVLPALLVLVSEAIARRDVVLGGAAGLVAGVFFIAVPWLMVSYTGGELKFTVFQFLAVGAYPLLGLAALGWLAVTRSGAGTSPEQRERLVR